MIAAFTGHRPNKLFGYDLSSPKYSSLRQWIKEVLFELKPEKAISGMALGVDQLCATICIELGIPFIGAVPFIGQEAIWPEHSQQEYKRILSKAAEVVIVSEGGYSAPKLQRRNEWMVNSSDVVIGIWNGSAGGTKNCIDYAKKKNKQIIIIDPIKGEIQLG